MIWDQGTHAPERESGGIRLQVLGRAEAEEEAQAGLRAGNLRLALFGEKLRGSFALVRTEGFGGNRGAWFLIKHGDGFCEAGYDANDYNCSAETGHTMEQTGEGAVP